MEPLQESIPLVKTRGGFETAEAIRASTSDAACSMQKGIMKRPVDPATPWIHQEALHLGTYMHVHLF
jgi:hypothetical protein